MKEWTEGIEVYKEASRNRRCILRHDSEITAMKTPSAYNFLCNIIEKSILSAVFKPVSHSFILNFWCIKFFLRGQLRKHINAEFSKKRTHKRYSRNVLRGNNSSMMGRKIIYCNRESVREKVQWAGCPYQNLVKNTWLVEDRYKAHHMSNLHLLAKTNFPSEQLNFN